MGRENEFNRERGGEGMSQQASVAYIRARCLSHLKAVRTPVTSPC